MSTLSGLLLLCLGGAPEVDRLVVFPLQGPAELTGPATDETLVALSRTLGLRVVGQTELDLALGYASEARAAGVCDEACVAEVAKAARASHLLQGVLVRLGDEWLLRWTLSRSDGQPLSTQATIVPSVGALGAAAGALALALLEAPRPEVGSSTTAAPSVERVAVLPMSAYADGAPTQALSQILLLELRRFGFIVISPDEIRTLLDYEAERQIRACEEDLECLAELGGALGVDHLVSGGVGRFGAEWVISLKLLHARTAAVLARSAETFLGPESELVPALRAALRGLLSRPAGHGWLELHHEADVEAEVDGQPLGTLPLRRAFSAGKHQLRLFGSGWQELRRDVYVEPDTSTRLVPELMAEPWWTRWYTWVAVGAVVVGASVGAALLLQSEPDAVLSPDLIVR